MKRFCRLFLLIIEKIFGQHKAIETFRTYIKEETENYTKDAWIFHIDFKGYFPNADVEIAYQKQKDLIIKYYNGYDKDDLLYMMDKVMHADPARNCEQLSISDWKYIEPQKSLFNKPKGTGRCYWISMLAKCYGIIC